MPVRPPVFCPDCARVDGISGWYHWECFVSPIALPARCKLVVVYKMETFLEVC